jgi:hypothetical protein
LGIPHETATISDVVIQAEFLDAAWGAGSRKIQYLALGLLDEATRTLSLYELTQESSSGLSFGADAESSFQSGTTLFRTVKGVGYGPDGKAYEYILDLGAITQAFKETAEAQGWAFKTVLKREKASYPAASAARASAPSPARPAKGGSSILFWILLALLVLFDLLLVLAGRGILLYATLLVSLTLLLVLKRIIAKGVLRNLFSFATAGFVAALVFVVAGMGPRTPAEVPDTGGTVTQQSGDVSVILPDWTLPEGAKLTIQPDANPPAATDDPDAIFQAYDIHLPQGVDLEGVAELRLPFRKELLPKDAAPEDAVGAAYYDPQLQTWEPVPCLVDAEKGFVSIYTDHFSKYAVVILKDGRKKLGENLPRFDSPPIHFYTEDELEQVFGEMAAGAAESPTAVEKGWSQFNKLYGLTGGGATVLEAAVGTETLKNVNKLMNEAGLGFALAQLAFDISKLDDKAAVQNFTKSGAFYAVSKWGGDALGLASAGVTFIDLALNEFGEAALDKNLQKWEGAYRRYYATERKVRRTTSDWYRIIAQLHKDAGSPEAFRKSLDQELSIHCDAFWKDAEGYAHVAEGTPGIGGFSAGGEITANPRQISDNYKAYIHRTSIKPALRMYARKLWLLRMIKAENDFNRLKAEMNKVFTVTVQLQNHGAVRNLQASAVRFVTPQGQVVHGQSFDGNGQVRVRTSLFGFLKAGGPVNVEVSIPAQGNTPAFSTRLSYQLRFPDTVLTVPYTPVPEESRPEAKKPDPPRPAAQPTLKPTPAPISKPAPTPEKTYDYEAAFAKWVADYKAQSNRTRRDETWGQDHVYTLEFTSGPRLVKDGPSPGIYGAHQIWDAWSFYTGDRKGQSGRSTVNSFAMDTPGGGLYISLGELRGKYPQFLK